MNFNYYFDIKNDLHPYTHKLPANTSFGTPINALRIEPIFKEGYHPCEKNGEWILVENHVGQKGYLNGEPHVINNYGPLPDGFTTEKKIEISLEDARKLKIAEIDNDTEVSILDGFEYTINDTLLHFSYDIFDQQNFADTANACIMSQLGMEGLPLNVTWNAYENHTNDYKGDLVRLTLAVNEFLDLYINGALVHKVTKMELGGKRKAKVYTANTLEELNAI